MAAVEPVETQHAERAGRPRARDNRPVRRTGRARMLGGWRPATRERTTSSLRDPIARKDGDVAGMSEGEQKALGEIRATISREIVRLQAEYYGKGPTKARTYIFDDLVVVVLEETFTRAEKTLAQRGEGEAIQHIRRRFQQQMAEDFVGVVEQATGRRVRAFLSDTDIAEDVSIETFLLADDRMDMSGFESA